MKVLLTGANGFVGSHILDTLRARGIPTGVLVRPTSDRRFIEAHLAHVEIHAGAIGDRQSLESAMRDATHVIHCAGVVKALRLEEFYQANQIGTRNVVEAVNRQDGRIQRLVHISSLAVGGPAAPDRPAREDDPPRPVSEYGKSKLAGEQEVRGAIKSEFVILRPPAVYGPRDLAFLPLFKAVRSHLQPELAGGRLPLSLVFVSDLAEAVVTCLTHPSGAGKTFYAAAPEIVTPRALAAEIAAQMKTWTLSLPVPAALLWPICCLQETISSMTGKASVLSRQKYAELRAPGWVCDASRLRHELGFTCATTLVIGIHKTLAWYREQRWL